MKREEAVAILENVIERETYHLDYFLDSIVESIAEKVMQAIEKDIKMLPPLVHLDSLNRYDNGWE